MGVLQGALESVWNSLLRLGGPFVKCTAELSGWLLVWAVRVVCIMPLPRVGPICELFNGSVSGRARCTQLGLINGERSPFKRMGQADDCPVCRWCVACSMGGFVSAGMVPRCAGWTVGHLAWP